jgi:hypothetical protein
MTASADVDVTCAVFRRLPPAALAPEAIHRFVVGEDTAPRRLTTEEASRELGDPFGVLVLLKGVFPRTAGEVLAALDREASEADALGRQMIFLVGEGSQIPFSPDTASLQRNLRFLVTRGSGPGGPDVLLSSFHPDEGDVELMAWDRRSGGFNFYRTVGANSAWVFAGNSRHALADPTQGKGPFESHRSGNILMKELRAPWIHWDSPDAEVLPSVFAGNDPLREHPWFRDKEPQGAFTCEMSVARPSIERWTKTRFAALVAQDGTVDQPERVMHQLLETPTVNLISSPVRSRDAVAGASVELPKTFFVDAEALKLLGLPPPPRLAVDGPLYGRSLQSFQVRLTDDNGFARPGDTHFAFVVPERAFEDHAVVGEAVRVGLISRRLAACLLMTDFPNPVFSARRAALVRHVPATANIQGGQSRFSADMAEAILAAAEGSAADSPEREFAERWAAGEAWREEDNRLLGDYYRAVGSQLTTQEGFDAYYRLAESRRDQVRNLPIFESPLLFAHTNIPSATRMMRRDGTVTEA